MSICKYCGKQIEDEPVMNPDENGNGYHHYCLIDMEFKTRDKQIYDKGRADALRRPCPECEHNDSIYICENCCYNYDSRFEIKRDVE